MQVFELLKQEKNFLSGVNWMSGLYRGLGLGESWFLHHTVGTLRIFFLFQNEAFS